tara:strand:+ start:43 stop:588 length:546 start_codon:yes stop_codon:yes gene_type:complete
MEGIKNLLVYIGIHGLALIIGFLLIGILFTLKEHINKINWLIRLLLIPAVIFLAIVTVSVISTNALALIAIFWYPGDAGFNVWIYSNIIIPGVTSYFLLWNVYFVSPFYKVYLTGFIGILLIAIYVFMLYLSMTTGVLLDGGILFETFDVEPGFYGTLALIISYIAGAVMAIKHSYEGELE